MANDKFLEIDNLPRLNQEETENLNRPITDKQLSRFASVINLKLETPILLNLEFFIF